MKMSWLQAEKQMHTELERKLEILMEYRESMRGYDTAVDIELDRRLADNG